MLHAVDAFDTTPRSGRVTPRATLILAPNPGPMTFDGTNTWVLHEPGSAEAAVLDPGPEHQGHFDRIQAVVRSLGATVTSVLLSHRHPDHAAGVRAFAAAVDAPVRANAAPLADDVLAGGEVLDCGGLRIQVLATPGHSSDSLSFHLPAEDATLTGDTVLGRGAPAILHPDGRLSDMMVSLRALRSGLPLTHQGVLLPGHGPVIRDPRTTLDRALRARHRRLAQIADALDRGYDTAERITDLLYADLDPRIRRAAEANIAAHLAYLDRPGVTIPNGAWPP